MKLNFLQDVLVLPASVLSHTDADAAALRVLLWLASDLSLADKTAQLAKLADCSAKEAEAAIAFWCDKGVLCADGKAIPVMAQPAQTSPAAPAKKKPMKRADELPNYTSTELAELLEKRESVRMLIDEAQQILGKIFNMSEVNIMVGMLDYLGMSEECILLLLAHCKRIGKVNLRAIEKYAYPLVERGITTSDLLEEELRTVEALRSFEGQVRSMFGMKSRALTSREDKMLRAWVSFGYDIEIVRRAYELTVQATGDASLPYANSILERWNSEGLKSAEEIDAAIAADAEKRSGQKGRKTTGSSGESVLGNSFDTDDYFEAALKRSFRETGADEVTGSSKS
ncbi:MAG: DnaD domain protein [Clostridia bacterium]|nr:DnaD domain protein [Clostridia bacterium]